MTHILSPPLSLSHPLKCIDGNEVQIQSVPFVNRFDRDKWLKENAVHIKYDASSVTVPFPSQNIPIYLVFDL